MHNGIDHRICLRYVYNTKRRGFISPKNVIEILARKKKATFELSFGERCFLTKKAWTGLPSQ